MSERSSTFTPLDKAPAISALFIALDALWLSLDVTKVVLSLNVAPNAAPNLDANSGLISRLAIPETPYLPNIVLDQRLLQISDVVKMDLASTSL